MPARILVAYASRKGSTAGIAKAIGTELRSAGYLTDVAEMITVSSLGGYDAVVIGAPVYTGKVLDDVAAFAACHKEALALLPVAGFVTGIAPVFPKTGEVSVFTGQLVTALTPVQPVAVTMFAGKLDAARLSFFERGLALLLNVPTGDFRDWAAIAAWARDLPGKMGLSPAPKD
jgi:menaquinone-dependent protoporphyrinogen oxidase